MPHFPVFEQYHLALFIFRDGQSCFRVEDEEEDELLLLVEVVEEDVEVYDDVAVLG